jgi:CSLREA domain-containing protein
MNTKLSIKRNTWKVLAAFLLASMAISTSYSIPVLANPVPENTRLDMMAIAYLYANYRWTAIESNVWHGPYNYLPDPNHPDERKYDWLLNPDGTLRKVNEGNTIPDGSIFVGGHVTRDTMETVPIDTPDGRGWAIGENIGIPYAWAGTTPVESDLNLVMKIAGGYFGQRIDAALPAGNIDTTSLKGGILTNGVDCEGFIENVWRLGARYGMDQTQGASRPIRFAELRPGDVLMSYTNGKERNSHVILFKEFVNYTSGDPVVLFDGSNDTEATKFKVYEASYSAGKVVEKTYMIIDVDTVPVSQAQYEDKRFWFNDHQFPIDEVQIIDAETRSTNGAPDPLAGEMVYVPRTYLNPLSVMFIIDNSGSISNDELTEAKLAAAGFLSAMRPGDKVGVISFNDLATPRMALTEIEEGGSQKSAALEAINSIVPDAGTVFVYPLALSFNALWHDNSNAGYLPGQAMVLFMSDGESPETDAELDPHLDLFKAANIPIYTFGVGTSVDDYMLGHIADKSGGRYFRSNKWGYFGDYLGAFSPLKTKNYREELADQLYGTVPSGGMIEETALVDSTMGTMTLSFVKSDSNLNLTLTQPDGSVIDPAMAGTNPNITYFSSPTYEGYTIRAPQSGTWKMSISSTTAGEYVISVSTWAAITLSVDADKEEYLPSDPIKLTASIKESGALTGPEYIYGATMQVTAEDPENNQTTYELYDDGLHDDGSADDGIYANAFTDTSLEGIYNFNVKISGNNNRDDQPFTREENFSVIVSNPPIVVSSVRASTNPTTYHNIYFRVNFSKPVTGVDTSDFALTTNGISGAEISNVSGSDSIYYVTITTGNGSGTIRLDVVDDDTIVNGYGVALGGTGIGNGNFTTGEAFDVNNAISSITVNKLADTNDGTCDSDCSLREAIESAPPDNTITFDAGLSGETIRLTSILVLRRNITIDGSALAVPITISGDTNGDGTGDVEVFYVNSEVIANLNNLTITKSQLAGIDNHGITTVTNSSLMSNGDSGIHNYDAALLTVMSSTFSDNTDGIFSYLGTVTVTNSTFSSNRGSGIYNNRGTLTVLNSTFSHNSASNGGGILNYFGATLNYANTIIANSHYGGDCVNYGAIGTNVNNLVEDGSCSALLSGDPNLGALADNGGLTQTMELLVGSPAIDAGDDATCAAATVSNLDQRGIARPQGPHCDIGAFESSDATSPVVQSITRASANPTNAASVEFTVTFSEPVVSVDTTNFTLTTTGGVTGASILAVSGPSDIYTVSVDTGSGDGTIRLDLLDDDTIVDNANNPLGGTGIGNGDFTTGQIYEIDKTAPAISSITLASANPTNAASVDFTIEFSEPVTGVDIGDFILTTSGISGASVNSVNGSGSTRTVTVNTGSGSGTLRLDVPVTAIIIDLAGNPLENLPLTSGESYLVVKSPPVGAGTYDDTHTAWVYSAGWTTYTTNGPYASSIHYTDVVGSYADLTFRGVRFTLTYTQDPSRGSIEVYVDGGLVGTLNEYGPSLAWQQSWTSPTFTDGTHMVRFVHAGGSGPYVDIDAITIHSPLPPGMYDDSSNDWVYSSGWTAYSGSGPYANTLHYTNAQGASATITFTGTQFKVWYTKYPNRGDVEVWIDGTLVHTFSEYGASQVWQQSWTLPIPLEYGTHTVEFKNPNGSTATYIDIDAIQIIGPVGAGTHDDAHPAWSYTGNWTAHSGSGPYANTLHYTNLVGSSAEITFTGEQFTLTYTQYPNRGSVEIYVDETLAGTLNEYGPSLAWQQTWTSPTFTNGIHTVRFVHAGGSDTYVDIDAITIHSPLPFGIYDDRHAGWLYTGSWLTYDGSGPYNSTDHYTSSLNSTASFMFSGTSFTLIYTAMSNRGNIGVYLDGAATPIDTINAYSASTLLQSTYTSPTLSAGTHTVVFKHEGPSGSYIDVDAITILP